MYRGGSGDIYTFDVKHVYGHMGSNYISDHQHVENIAKICGALYMPHKIFVPHNQGLKWTKAPQMVQCLSIYIHVYKFDI